MQLDQPDDTPLLAKLAKINDSSGSDGEDYNENDFDKHDGQDEADFDKHDGQDQTDFDKHDGQDEENGEEPQRTSIKIGGWTDWSAQRFQFNGSSRNSSKVHERRQNMLGDQSYDDVHQFLDQMCEVEEEFGMFGAEDQMHDVEGLEEPQGSMYGSNILYDKNDDQEVSQADINIINVSKVQLEDEEEDLDELASGFDGDLDGELDETHFE